MKKERKQGKPIFHPIRSMTAIGWRIIVFAFAVWLVAMGLITHSIATEIYVRMQHIAQEFVSIYAEHPPGIGKVNPQLPGYPEYCRIERLSFPSHFELLHSASPLFFKLPDKYNVMIYDVAISYQDRDDSVIDTTGSYLSFTYMTSELWQTAQSIEEASGFTYIDLNKVDTACYTQEDDSLYYFNRTYYKNYKTGRFTGYFEKNEFIPICVEYTTYPIENILEEDRNGQARWYSIYQAPAPTGKELVTIYGVNHFGPTLPFGVGIWDMGPVTVDGTEYAKLEDAMYAFAEKDSLMDAVVIAWDSYTDTAGEKIFVRAALRAQPLPYTMRKLSGFYILSFGVMALAVWLILRKIDRQLARPTAQVAYCSTGEPKPLPEHKKARWLETRTLQENYEVMVDAHYRAKTELRQLQTALDYAQNAEIKRREMISNITHELKTPLAIIHSYAEGLKDGIAADKQEQYLSVILEEAERMDGMVLEMLDLSRLEAGKVRLSSDRFSLLGLTRSIFDRLAPVSAEKNLQIEYYLVEEFDITADESRIGQVITNFATNAIKYTPEGGRIWIKVYRHREQTILCIENECAPLPDEALSKIWDSFYRAEASRTTKGTGLGLAIAKAIIELHGGTVSAQNTSTGVEFRCTLP